MHRNIEHVRDRVLRGAGTEEAVIETTDAPLVASRQWRKPLRLDEINRLAPTREVRLRPGRA
jgi:hypothetical protein